MAAPSFLFAHQLIFCQPLVFVEPPLADFLVSVWFNVEITGPNRVYDVWEHKARHQMAQGSTRNHHSDLSATCSAHTSCYNSYAPHAVAVNHHENIFQDGTTSWEEVPYNTSWCGYSSFKSTAHPHPSLSVIANLGNVGTQKICRRHSSNSDLCPAVARMMSVALMFTAGSCPRCRRQKSPQAPKGRR